MPSGLKMEGRRWLLPFALLLAACATVLPGLRTSLVFTSSHSTAHSPWRTSRRGNVARFGGLIEIPGDMKNGLKILVDGEPIQVLEFQAQKRGRGGAIMKTKVKNLLTGARTDKTFGTGTKWETFDTEWKAGTYSYFDEATDSFMFLDSETFEEIMVPSSVVGTEKARWIVEGSEVDVETWDGRILDIRFQGDLELEVAEVGQKSDSVQKQSIQATLSNGVTMSVPYYIKVGDKVLINSISFAFMKRL
mmetsp:Transcript_69264/g.166093  ORF Transcript_69264/g.166093 Transcript_69264/m.166093 type:complete len:248 (+) Transcript_69264:70-813(+)